MRTGTARLITLVVLASIPACGGGGDGGVNGPPALTTVEISPNPVTVFMGDTIKLTATAKDQHGNTIAAQRVTWASDATTVASVDSLGTVVAVASGTARISATIEGKTGTVSLTSTGPGTTGAVTGSATIGTTGGAVQATLPGGGTMSLSVPSGALRASATITLEPLVPPPGALASFHLTPAGVPLDKDATLVIKLSPGAKLRPTSTLVFEHAGQRIPVASVPNLADGTLTVSLSTLGLTEAAASGVSSRTRVANAHSAAGSVTGSVYNLALDILYVNLQAALDRLVALGTVATAENAQLAWEAITGQGVAPAKADSRYVPFRNHWTQAVCGNANFAFNALSSFNFVSDYRGLERVMVAVIHWHRAAKAMDEHLRVNLGEPVTCFNALPDPNTRIHTKLTTLEPSIRADLNQFAVEPAPRDRTFFTDRLKPLIDLGASLSFLGNPQDGQIVSDIVRDQMIRLRTLGYTRCRDGTSQEIQGTLARNAALVPLPGLNLGDLQDDIVYCGMRIQWAVLDSVSISVSNGTLGGGLLAGAVTTNASATLFGDGQLRLRGPLQALLCPAPGSANNEQLEIVAGRSAQSLTRVAVLSPSNANQYLAVSDLLIGTDTLRAVAGLGPNDVGTVTVVVRRIGGVCSGLLALPPHSTLATIQLTLENDPVMYFKDFTTGPAGTEWSTALVTTSPAGQRFLGELGNSSTTLRIDSLRAHTRITLEFDIYIIDSWNGNGGIGSASAPDIIEVSVVGGAVLKKTTFSNKPSDPQAFPGNHPGSSFPAGTGALGKGTLGYPPDSDHFGDSSYRLRLTFDHTGSSIQIRFASQQTSGQNERWGVDNVRLSRLP
jgi:hypothetical protein